MTITTGQNAVASDFINKAGKNATPANDAGRVAKLEADGKEHPFFTKNGFIPNAGATINGATLPVPVYQNKTDNEVYACDGNDTSALKFIGFATSNSTNGNPIDVQTSGIVGGFSGLDEGEKYYLQDAVGTIGTTAGTYAVLVGVAISTTELLIQKGKRRTSGSLSISPTPATTTITCGFRISSLRMSMLGQATNIHYISHGGWTVDGGNDCCYMKIDSGGTTETSGVNASCAYAFDSGQQGVVNISNVTDTAFDIVYTETGGDFSAATLRIFWDAEGEQ